MGSTDHSQNPALIRARLRTVTERRIERLHKPASRGTKEQNAQVDGSHTKRLVPSLGHLQPGNKIKSNALCWELKLKERPGERPGERVGEGEADGAGKTTLLLPAAVFLRPESPRRRLQTPPPV